MAVPVVGHLRCSSWRQVRAEAVSGALIVRSYFHSPVALLVAATHAVVHRCQFEPESARVAVVDGSGRILRSTISAAANGLSLSDLLGIVGEDVQSADECHGATPWDAVVSMQPPSSLALTFSTDVWVECNYEPR